MRRHLHALLTVALSTKYRMNRTSQKLRLQVHGIEGIDGLVIVGLDLTWQRNFHQSSLVQLCGTPCGGVLRREDSPCSPSGISSRPLSTEAMIAVWLM